MQLNQGRSQSIVLKSFRSQKTFKFVIVLKIYFRASDAFQQLLKRSKSL